MALHRSGIFLHRFVLPDDVNALKRNVNNPIRQIVLPRARAYRETRDATEPHEFTGLGLSKKVGFATPVGSAGDDHIHLSRSACVCHRHSKSRKLERDTIRLYPK